MPSAEELAAFGRREVIRLAEHHQRAAQRDLERSLGRAGIPRRFRASTFDGYRAETAAQRDALTICRRFAEQFDEADEYGRSLLLIGGPGTGKTHLACAILAAVLRAGRTGLFVTVSEALRTIRDSYSPRAARTESEAFALFAEPDLLVLDEVGVAIGDAEKRRALLFDLLNARYAEQRALVLIANLTVPELHAYLGERILDRLLESGSAVVPFTWDSYRRRRHD